MDAIHLEDLVFYAYHGLHEEEERLGQRFHVDVTCWLDISKAAETDEYSGTVCYGSLVQAMERVVTQNRFKLIERLAAAVADGMFAVDDRIQKARVRIHKPGAPLPIATGKVSVEIVRLRPAVVPEVIAQAS